MLHHVALGQASWGTTSEHRLSPSFEDQEPLFKSVSNDAVYEDGYNCTLIPQAYAAQTFQI